MYNFILSQTYINIIFLFQKSAITVEYNYTHTARHINMKFLFIKLNITLYTVRHTQCYISVEKACTDSLILL